MNNLASLPPKEDQSPPPLAWAGQLRFHLKQFHKELYRDLKRQGKLQEYCLNEARKAVEESQRLAENGMGRFEADLLAMKHHIWPLNDEAKAAGVSEDL